MEEIKIERRKGERWKQKKKAERKREKGERKWWHDELMNKMEHLSNNAKKNSGERDGGESWMGK